MASSHGTAMPRAWDVSIGNGSSMQSIKSQPWRAQNEAHGISRLQQSVFAKPAQRINGGRKLRPELEYHLAQKRNWVAFHPGPSSSSRATRAVPEGSSGIQAVRHNGWGNQKDSKKEKIGN